MTETTVHALPDLDTVYYSEDLGPITLRSVLDGLDADLVPKITLNQTTNDYLAAWCPWLKAAVMNSILLYCRSKEEHGIQRSRSGSVLGGPRC